MEAKKLFSKLGWAYIAFFIVSTGIQFLIAFAVSRAGGSGISTNTSMLLSQFAMYGCGFPVFVYLIRKMPVWNRDEKQKIGTCPFLLWLVFCFGLTYSGNLIGQAMMLGVRLLGGNPPLNPVDTLVAETSPWVLLLCVVFVAPVMEELLFRKLLIDRIIQYGQPVAIIVSGIAFGLYHGNFYQFFYACSMGMVFAYLYSRTGDIRYNIFIHMIINFVGGFVPTVLLRGIQARNAASLAGILMLPALMLGSMISAVVLCCIYARKLPVFAGWAEIPEKGIWRTILPAPGVIGFFVMSIVLFLWT